MRDNHSGDRHSTASPEQMSVVGNELTSNKVASKNSVITTTGACHPGDLCQRIHDAVQEESTVRVIAPNEHVAAAVDSLTKQPVAELTDGGAVPYRTTDTLRTSDGNIILKEESTPPATVEFLADTGIKLTVGRETIQLPFGGVPTDVSGDLPTNVAIAQDTANTDEWQLTRGDEIVTTLSSRPELTASYHRIQGWFEPDRLSYRGDITIHYPDPANNDELRTYKSPTQKAATATSEPLATFLRQFSVDCQGSHLARTEVLSRYRAWLDAADQMSPCRSEFSEAFAHIEDMEMVGRSDPTKQRMICDRAWRFPVTHDR